MALTHDRPATRQAHLAGGPDAGADAGADARPGVVALAETDARAGEDWSGEDHSGETREDALRRVVAGISASLELDEVFEDVLESSRTLFHADAAAPVARHPRASPPAAGRAP